MEKKIRFPLEMEQGVQVRSMEELRENFSLSRVLVYLSNGKLVTWLRDRYADDISNAIEGLNTEDDELPKKVCEIFEIEVDWNEKEISLVDVKFDSAYQQIVDEHKQTKITKEKTVEEVTVEKVLFRMNIADVFTIDEIGTVAIGHIDEGKISVGDTITLKRKSCSYRDVVITTIEMCRKLMDKAEKGDDVGLLLGGVQRDEVSLGDILERVVYEK